MFLSRKSSGMNRIQERQPSQIAQLRRDWPIQLIVVEGSKIDEGSGSRTRRHSNNNGINGVQGIQPSHLAQLRRDCPIQLIAVEVPMRDQDQGLEDILTIMDR